MEKRENAIPKTMKAWAVTTPGPIDGQKSPIEFTEKPVQIGRASCRERV